MTQLEEADLTEGFNDSMLQMARDGWPQMGDDRSLHAFHRDRDLINPILLDRGFEPGTSVMALDEDRRLVLWARRKQAPADPTT